MHFLQIGEISLMKEMTSVATTMMTEEEKAEMEREMNEAHAAASPIPPGPATITPQPHVENGPVEAPTSPARAASPSPFPPAAAEGQDSLAAAAKSPASSSTSNLKECKGEKEKDAHGKKRAKLTPEQKKKLQELDDERKKNMEERVETLAKKLVDRLRPFVDAQHPGDKDDPETRAFEAKMRREADDLKLESFGVELLHTIGNIYIMKATSFLKSKKFLGM